MTPLTGTYEGRDYEIEPFPTDDGVRAWFVQRDGGERHEVRISPPDCTCGDFEWRRRGLHPVPCKHVRAVRHILNTPPEPTEADIYQRTTETLWDSPAAS